MAERLRMSRTPIREALRRLEERGMVRILPRRGAVVSDISPSEVENIYAVRGHLEVFAARLAAQRISREGLTRVAGMEAAHAKLAGGRDVRALMLTNDRFHVETRPGSPTSGEEDGLDAGLGGERGNPPGAKRGRRG